MTYARNACDQGYAVPYCCDEAVQTTERCFWAGEANAFGSECQNAKSCPAYHVEVAEGRGGRLRSGGVTREACKEEGECEVKYCNIKAGCTDYYCHNKFTDTDEKLCCPAEDLNIVSAIAFPPPCPPKHLLDDSVHANNSCDAVTYSELIIFLFPSSRLIPLVLSV